MRNIFYLSAFVVMLALLGACKEDNVNFSDDNGDNKTVIELSRFNAFFDLELPSKNSWEVIYAPEWVGPVSKTGSADDKLTFFAETNDNDEDRMDKITVLMGNGNNVEYVVKQMGAQSDNSNGVVNDISQLSRTCGVCYGIDAFKMPSGPYKYDMKVSSPFKLDKLINAIKESGETDAIFIDNNYYSRTESMVGSSTNELSNQLSVNAGIEVGVSAFKLSVEGGFSQSSSSSDKFSYAMEEIQHITSTAYVSAGMLRYLAENGEDIIFQKTFRKYYEEMKTNPNKDTMKRIIDNYGTHIITSGMLGGELKLSMQMKVTEKTTASDIHAALNISSKVVNASGNVNLQGKEKDVAENTTISLTTFGGNNVYSISPGTSFTDFQSQVKDPKKIENWISTIKSGKSLALIDIQTIPIYELMPTQEARDAMRSYIISDYQQYVYSKNGNGDYSGLDLFKITGLDLLMDEIDGTLIYDIAPHTIHIPEIDMEINLVKEKIPEIDSYSDIITLYSGKTNNVNYKSGFFIGNEDHKPCKFRHGENGVELETLDFLEKKPVSTLYIDATCNITIAPKSIAEYYREVGVFKSVNLDNVTEETSFNDNIYIISGKTNNKVNFIDCRYILVVDPDVSIGQMCCSGITDFYLRNSNSSLKCGNIIALNSTDDFPGLSFIGEGSIIADTINENPDNLTVGTGEFFAYCANLSVNSLSGFSSIIFRRGQINIKTLDLYKTARFLVLDEFWGKVVINEMINYYNCHVYFDDNYVEIGNFHPVG